MGIANRAYFSTYFLRRQRGALAIPTVTPIMLDRFGFVKGYLWKSVTRTVSYMLSSLVASL